MLIHSWRECCGGEVTTAKLQPLWMGEAQAGARISHCIAVLGKVDCNAMSRHVSFTCELTIAGKRAASSFSVGPLSGDKGEGFLVSFRLLDALV